MGAVRKAWGDWSIYLYIGRAVGMGRWAGRQARLGRRRMLDWGVVLESKRLFYICMRLGIVYLFFFIGRGLGEKKRPDGWSDRFLCVLLLRRQDDRACAATHVVPRRRPFSPKGRSSFSPTKPIFEPWDAIPTTPNICQPELISRDVDRPGLVRTSYIQVYKITSTSMVMNGPRTRTDGHEKPPTGDGLICKPVADASERTIFV